MEGQVAITFKSYLTRLNELERAKPEEVRRDIPSIPDIARAAGIHPVTASRLMHGHVNRVSLDKLAAILNVMNDYGFNTKLTDFFVYTRQTTMDMATTS